MRPTAPVAAIDLGTNTALQLVARLGADGALEVLDDRSVTARLGRGLARTGGLEDEAIERTLGILADFQRRADELGVPPERRRAVGTAVLRRARDAARFLDAARTRLGLEVEVIAEEEEARLGHAAVAAEGGAQVVIVDVGGGSSEVSADEGRVRISAPIGAVVLTERYLGLEGAAPVEAGGFGALLAEVANAASVFPAGAGRGADVVLLGGTAANLANLERAAGRGGGARFDPAVIEGVTVAASAAAEWAERLAGESIAARCARPIEADRAEILPAGLACLAAILARLEAGRARVSARGLRYGLARAMLVRAMPG